MSDPESARKMVENYESKGFDIEVSLADYASLEKPLAEVFTLNSGTCAACGYMKSAVVRAVYELGEMVDLVEYKFTTAENVSRVMKLGAKNLPSLYIHRELKFSA